MTSRMKTTALVLAAALALCALPAAAQPSVEGYDPMLQITHQFAHPNLLIVLDVTGSMVWEQTSTKSAGVDGVGLPTWTFTRSNTSGCTGSQGKTWTATLTKHGPSRMAVVKNALGMYVSLYALNAPSPWPVTYAGWTFMGLNVNGEPYWNKVTATCSSQPAPPFTAPTIPAPSAGNPSPAPTPTCPGLTLSSPPQDLVGKTSSLVNWGLAIFSTGNGDCMTTRNLTLIDRNEGGNVTAIENYLKLQKDGGLNASGGTNTSGGLNFAKTILQKTATGGSFTDSAGTTWTQSGPDVKFAKCGRTYGVILVTDGLSNSCNPNGGDWINPCGSTMPYICDASSSGYDCDRRGGVARRYDLFPAKKTEELWYLTAAMPAIPGSPPIPAKTANLYARTWVIGVSTAVSPCELNFDAYMGHTDASSPNGDAGFDTAADPYLPTAVGDESKYSTAHGNYAYFATTASALKDAFAAIIAAVAAGDYTTSAPISASSTSSGTLAILASAEYPSWKGHVYGFDTSKLPTDPLYLAFDAGAVLATQTAASRRMYTWDTSGNLLELKSTNLSQIQAAAAAFSPGFTAANFTSNVLDFARGNNGVGAARPWTLGPIVNSTPAIIQAPQRYKQGFVQDHTGFESTYATRTPLLWVGANDGILHAFLVSSKTIGGTTYPAGSEMVAVLPPNLLAKQVDLYNSYDPVGAPVGEPKLPGDHIYGVANSPRFGDVWFPAANKYKTVLYLSEGPGGNGLAALDVTDPVGNIIANPTQPPIGLVWNKNGTSLPGLQATWSVPAMGASTPTDTKGVVGSGYDPNNTTTTPYAYTFDPVYGTFASNALSPQTTPTPYMRNQTFSDAVIYSMTAKAYYPDNLVNMAVQPDLHGRIWFMPSPSWVPSVGIDASTKAGQSQPIYYPPAVSGYYKASVGYDLYAFVSGTFYEKDPDVTGPNVGTGTYFAPSLYLAARTPTSAGSVPAGNVLRIKINSLTYTDTTTTPPTTYALGPRTQATAPPFLFVPIGDTGNPVALFLLYDPDSADCAGTSYIVKLTVTIGATGVPAQNSLDVYSAGSGAGSGFGISGGKVIVAKSGVGKGKRAGVSEVPGVNPTEGLSNPLPIWWRELQ